MDFLKGLNPPQVEAVTHVDGPLLILAGAGSGKTRVITHRIAHLVRDHRVPPSAVMAVTFTNKAAQEMRDRVLRLLADEYLDSKPNLSTFHSFCVRMLRRDGDPLAGIRPGFTRQFTIYDEEDQLALVKAAFKHLGLDEQFMKYRAALSAISSAKNRKETPEDFYKKAADPRLTRLAVLFDEYEKALRKANALDFDDLLLESVRLLRRDEATRARWNRRIGYLMIDEYQDTNRSQYELMRLLCEQHSNVAVVGDEDQSIYSWRGADIKNILDFGKDFKNARVIRLEQNYRSTKNILDAAGAVVARNQERVGKTLWTESPAGERIGLYAGFDAENEALFIADTIERLLAGKSGDRVAVLYRTNSQSRQIEEALRRYGRKYSVVGGFSFYQRAEIKDIVAYLKLALSPEDPIALLRIVNTPARGIGKTTVEQIEQFARRHDLTLWIAIGRMLDEGGFPPRAHAALSAFLNMMAGLLKAVAERPLPEALHEVLERTGYKKMLERDPSPEAQSRLENLDELLNAAVEAAGRGEGAVEFLDHAALVSDADSVDERAQISLLTLHNAKGLEFPIVFLAGLEEGLFPHSRSLDSESLMEEERRLCYVGMTRAEKRLFLTWAKYRRRFGSREQERSTRSRFLEEVPRALIQPLGAGEARPQVDLTAEAHEVRETARRNTFTGKTYNSLENISQFFAERGIPVPPAAKKPADAPPARPAAARPSKPKLAATVEHPKYGRGTVVRREGEGDDAKITVSFPGYGLKKLVQKYAGLKNHG
ncbi:MAG: UvrD-helicase domain-containing protein [Acidobacteria bacterium]|nr:UvrD-helicase domain-containing protein [Acidobacteriota bacterium]